ncbi:hypothetical protein DL93DRAFT_2232240 [Clavulina sp. PMI_390]|nr:hypothetical protein DL93DRAFT_2232240 [Clavulina sp. PMI_390]
MSFSVGAVYQMINKASGTAADYSQRDFRSLIGYKAHGGPAQQWMFEEACDGLYYIRCTKSEMPYISYEGSPRSGDKAICTRSPRPWKVVRDSNHQGCFKVLHPDGKLCLDLNYGRPDDFTPIILYQLTSNSNQAWNFKLLTEFSPNMAPRFRLTNKATNTVAGLASNNRSVVGEDRVNNRSAQVWSVETVDASKNRYRIKNVGTGQYLSFNGNLSASNPLLATPDRKEWEIRLQGNTFPQEVKIYAPGSNYLVDLTASNPKAGTPVILYPTQNPGINQQWKIERAD